MSEQKNWFGWSIHPTDDMLHWSEVKFGSKGRLNKKTAIKVNRLRASYDAIANAGLEEHLKVLLAAAYEQGRDDESDSHNPDI